MGFDELCALEPRLRSLYEEAQAVKDDGEGEWFCANDIWYGYGGFAPGFKRRLERLVGHIAGLPEEERAPAGKRVGRLQIVDFASLVPHDRAQCQQGIAEELLTSDAYDCAYETIYDQLPDCRGACACAHFD